MIGMIGQNCLNSFISFQDSDEGDNCSISFSDSDEGEDLFEFFYFFFR